MKNLKKLKGANVLSKNQQKVVQGGLKPGASSCSTICINAPYGQRCNTHPGCPEVQDGMCDGNGGFYYL